MPAKFSKTRDDRPRTVFAKKSFGQNFLVDQNYIDKIISALAPQGGETIVEIGAGRGALTEKLVASGANVLAVELERDMISILKEKFGGEENFRLIESDVLKIDFDDLTDESRSPVADRQPVKLVANLPYYISTAILQKLIEQRGIFAEIILMFQLEVVERITAAVGNSERGYLTVLTEAFFETEKLFEVPPAAFRPAPKVRSAVVRLKPKAGFAPDEEKLFREIISAAFRQKRKTISNNLKAAKFAAIDWSEVLHTAEIEPNRRAESLHLEEWRKIVAAVRVKNADTDVE